MQPQMRWSKNPKEIVLGSSFAIGKIRNRGSRYDANGGGRDGRSDPSSTEANQRKEFSLAIGLCVLHKKVGFG